MRHPAPLMSSFASSVHALPLGLVGTINRVAGKRVEILHELLPDLRRPEGANHQWRRNPPGELSIDPVADERLMRVTAWVGAS
jgi:hypothetical protein